MEEVGLGPQKLVAGQSELSVFRNTYKPFRAVALAAAATKLAGPWLEGCKSLADEFG